MPFDPDAFLAEQTDAANSTAVTFDPDAFLMERTATTQPPKSEFDPDTFLAEQQSETLPTPQDYGLKIGEPMILTGGESATPGRNDLIKVDGSLPRQGGDQYQSELRNPTDSKALDMNPEVVRARHTGTLKADHPVQAAVKEVAMEVAPTAAALAAASETAAVAGRFGGLPAFVGGLAAAMIVGGLTRKAQDFGLEKLLGDDKMEELNTQLEVNREAYPKTTFGAQMVPQAIFLKPSSLNQIKTAYEAAVKLGTAEGKAMLETEAGRKAMGEAINLVVGSGTGAATEAWNQIQNGQFDATRMVLTTVLGGVLSNPTKAGKAIGLGNEAQASRVEKSQAKPSTPEQAPKIPHEYGPDVEAENGKSALKIHEETRKAIKEAYPLDTHDNVTSAITDLNLTPELTALHDELDKIRLELKFGERVAGRMPQKNDRGEIIGWMDAGAAYPGGLGADTIPAIRNYLDGKTLTENQQRQLAAAVKYSVNELSGQAGFDVANQTPIYAEDMRAGDQIELSGEKFTVKGVDPDTGNITLKDGKLVTMKPGETILADRNSHLDADGKPPSQREAAPFDPDTFLREQEAERSALDPLKTTDEDISFNPDEFLAETAPPRHDLGEGISAEQTPDGHWELTDADGNRTRLDPTLAEDHALIQQIDPEKRAAEVKHIATETAEKLPGAKLHFIDDEAAMNTVRANLGEAVKEIRAEDGSVRGFAVVGSNDYFILTRNMHPDQAASTVIHEAVGHIGIRGVLGDRIDTVMDGVFSSKSEHDATLNRIAKDYSLDLTTQAGRREAAEELLAHVAERRNKDPGAWKRLVAKIKDYFRQIGFEWAQNWTDNDVAALIQRAKERVSKKSDEVSGAGIRFKKVSSDPNQLAFEFPAKTDSSADSQQASGIANVDAAKPAESAIQDFGEKIGGARKDTADRGFERAKKTQQESTGEVWRKPYVTMEKVDGSGWTIGKRGDRWGISAREGQKFATEAEAEKAIPLFAVADTHRVWENPDKTWSIFKRVTDRKLFKVVNENFPSREEAMKYMALHAEDILNTKTTFGEEILPVPEIATRKGVERRTKDATPEMFMETFSPRGIEFGNWNNQAERQQIMNHAFDGLMDLSDVLGVPPKALMLNGDLGIGFGSRGHGLSGAKAHYEPDYGVINLTKMKGAGSLAHEWMHALDHYLARLDTKSSSEKMPNDRGDMTYNTRSNKYDMQSHGPSYRSQLRAELKDKYDTLVKSFYKKAQQYVEDTRVADEFLGKAKEQLRETLNSVRTSMLRDDSTYIKTKYGKPASTELLAEFDRLADSLVEGGNLETKWVPNDPNNKRSFNGHETNETLDALNKVLKAAKNRSGFRTERGGALDAVASAMKIYRDRIRMLDEAKAGTEKSKNVSTNYAIEAKKMDQARSGDYWSEPHEMTARAFAAYVEDKIAERGGQSDFLVYHAHGGILLPMLDGFVARPYPEGAERVAIGKLFDGFLKEIKTRETDKGVAMFKRGEAGLTAADRDMLLKSAKQRLYGRPDLSQITTSKQTRDLVAEVDQSRNEKGQPTPQTFKAWKTDADTRVQKDVTGEWLQFLSGKLHYEGDDAGQNTMVARKLLESKGLEAFASGDDAEIAKVGAAIWGYRNTRSNLARALAAGRDFLETPAERNRRWISEALYYPGAKVDRKLQGMDLKSMQGELQKRAGKMQEIRTKLLDMGIDLGKLDEKTLNDPHAMAEIVRQIQISNAGYGDMAYEYWRNGILSALPTHAANITGNTLSTAWQYTAQKWTEALINGITKSKTGTTFKELPGMYRALWSAKQQAARNAVTAFSTEQGSIEGIRLDDKGVAIPGTTGRIIRTPQRFLLASDEFSKTMILQAELYSRAYQEAHAKGWRGDGLERRIKEILADPKSDMVTEAIDEAKRLVFQAQPGEITMWLMKSRSIPGLQWLSKYVMPFVSTPTNIVKMGVRKTPLGLLRMAKEAYTGQYKENRQALVRDTAEQMLAMATTFALISLVSGEDDNGMPRITGSGPSGGKDAGKQQAEQRLAPAQSIRLGGRWYSYSRIEPLATAITHTIDVIEAIKNKPGEDSADQLGRIVSSMKSLARDKTFLSTIGDIIRATEDDSKGVSLVQNFASSWIPNIIRSGARATDPYYRSGKLMPRDDKNTAQELATNIGQAAFPAAAIQDAPRMDYWGRPLQKTEGFGPATDVLWRLVSPMTVQHVHAPDNFDRMLFNYNRKANAKGWEAYWPAMPGNSFELPGVRGIERTARMNPDEYSRFLKRRGDFFFTMAAGKAWKFEDPSTMEIAEFKKLMSKATVMAKNDIFMERKMSPASKSLKLLEESKRQRPVVKPLPTSRPMMTLDENRQSL